MQVLAGERHPVAGLGRSRFAPEARHQSGLVGTGIEEHSEPNNVVPFFELVNARTASLEEVGNHDVFVRLRAIKVD